MKLRHSEQGAKDRGTAQGSHQNPVIPSPPLLSSTPCSYQQSSDLYSHAPHGSETGGSLEISPLLSIFPKHPICPKAVIMLILTPQASAWFPAVKEPKKRIERGTRKRAMEVL